ncbi:tyrosine-type recombinase/integrase [Ochrobactrum daejeonense]|nr:tyrosine-type recombinase/integrase [Brucella daejeonensis]
MPPRWQQSASSPLRDGGGAKPACSVGRSKPRTSYRYAGDTKTGFSIRPLSKAACDALGPAKSSGLVFIPARGETLALQTHWEKLKLPAGITLHTLRHSFASLAADLGYSEPTIGALLGHKSTTITARYVHFADAVLVAAADAVADETSRRLSPFGAGHI